MPWISSYSIVLVVALVSLGLLVGRIRGDPRPVVALYTIGLVIVFFGLAWAIS